MIKNYFKIAWRNLIRHKSHAVINISGLAVGIAAGLMLFTIVRYEFSYDQFQPNYKHIYHIASERRTAEGTDYGEGVPFPAYDALKLEFPQAVTSAMFWNNNSQVTVLDTKDPNAVSNKKFIEETGVFFSDPQFFSVFQYKWLAGAADVLKQPDMAVLTRKMAEKYFGNWREAIGGLLKLDNTATVKIAGVLENLPSNTDFPLAVVASYETMKKYPDVYGYRTDWGNVRSDFQSFMLLPSNVNAATVNKQLIAFSNEHVNTHPKDIQKVFYFLQPLSDIHFDTRIGNFGDHITSRTTLWTLSLIGVFIILMACINFINLTTAQAVGRSKEIGIKKVLGSNRKQLFWQMMGETALIVVAAIVLAIIIASACLPYIKHIASIDEKLTLLNTSTALFIICAGIIVVILAGIYPSLILSAFKPIVALKNKITSAKVGSISLRRGLVITQFAISQVLIISTIVAVSQMNYVKHADLGFNKDAVLVLNSNVDSSVNVRQPAFKQTLLTIPGVRAVSFSSDVPSSESNNSGSFAYDHKPLENFDLFRKFGDEDYFKTYGLEIIAGRPYTPSDTLKEVVVNETLVRKLGIKDPHEILGHEILTARIDKRQVWCPIVGVVKDFKTNSLREAIKPTVIGQRNKRYFYTGIKLVTNNLSTTLAEIEKKWNQTFPEFVYAPTFMDERINDFYKQENQLSLLYKFFAAIAILISCLGLYGLISFMSEQKTKEVGIRKVLGASVTKIIYLFSKEFTILIIIAFALAAPLAYYIMSKWLNNFAFRINIGVLVFVVAIITSVLIAWITVGYKSFQAALANPVKSLRTE
jgi:putative ABC transport system permease protein